jgi:biotin-dependent carboxylase-like uncharacterized protein
MSLDIIKSGFLSLIQDYGRYGYQRLGVTTGGPMDEHAFLWANYLLGNSFNAPALEISYGGFSARFTRQTMIAVCGADLSITINNLPLTPWQTYAVDVGDIIEFMMPKAGMRSYLAVKGGFNVSPHLHSCSTVIREKLGGLCHDGQKLQVNDKVDYETYPEEPSRRVPAKFVPQYSASINLRFVPNTSETGVDQHTIDAFVGQGYEVTQNIDRMGYRLSGTPINTDNVGIVSQGISMGSIQLPKDGQPIVLMRDRQTIGGYPLLGCIAALDISLLAQSAPGTKVWFTAVDIDDIEPELILYKKFFSVSA